MSQTIAGGLKVAFMAQCKVGAPKKFEKPFTEKKEEKKNMDSEWSPEASKSVEILTTVLRPPLAKSDQF